MQNKQPRQSAENRSGDNFVLRCKLSQLFPIEEDQAAYNKINRIVDDVRSSSIEVVATQPIKHQCYNCHAPRSLLISNHEAEKREQHVEHKNNRQCPTHTNDRNIRIWQKSLA